jgi:diguanylate cyclase (GGDEF)-like protein
LKGVTGSLGFKLTVASTLVVAVFIFIAGVTVYKISQDAILQSNTLMAKKMSDDVRLEVAKGESIDLISDTLISVKLKKSGSVWLMDKDGFLLFHPDPVYREEYVKPRKELGNIVISLQYASPRAPGQSSYREKLIDIIGKYDEGFGEYQQFGETRVIAFRVIKEKGWLVAVDEPKGTAYSELNRIRTYIVYTGIISAILILLFTWIAIRVIVKPYYREVEELNAKLTTANSSLVISNDRLEVLNRKMTALYRISITMQETLSLQDILDIIVSGAQEVLQVDRVGIMLPDGKEANLVCRAAVGVDKRDLSEISLPVSAKGGAVAAAFKRGQVIRVDGKEHFPPHFRLSAPWADDPFFRSRVFVVLPMVVKNKVVGVIAFDNKIGRAPITDEMVNLIQIFSNQASVAVENARLYDEKIRTIEALDAKVDQLAIVNQISNSLKTMVKRKDMLGFILRGIRESMGFDALTVFLIDREEEVIKGEAGVGVPEEWLDSTAVPLDDEDHPLSVTVARGMPTGWHSLKDVDLVTALGRSSGEGVVASGYGVKDGSQRLSLAVIPLTVIDQVRGVIVVARGRKNPFISKQDVELLMLFANTAGLAVERSSFYEKTQEDFESVEITDQITRLFTYKYGQQRLHEEMLRAREVSRPLTVGMLGLDNFKEYNERNGQENGDKALGEIGHLVKMILAENDIAFRYGGRLLCFLFPAKPLPEVHVAAEKLLRIIAEHLFPGAKGAGDQRLTASIGLCEFRNQAELHAPQEVFKAAMAGLHRAEAAGGNKIFTNQT